ncbi:sensor histidine kinase [Novosphingobium tardum]|uniref:histidine kinase n=1 Tax=Novosphingobium tardum TaxID=1538021 RepID=A0ABV8RTI5_9SPHN
MIVDDRLETVLRTLPASRASARIQYRQLIDLLGRELSWAGLPIQATQRLDALAADLSATDRAEILRAARGSLRNPLLIRHLVEAEPAIASAAVASARLDDSTWASLIPDLPVTARGFLRHRTDLGPKTAAVLRQLGIGDLVLAQPEAEAGERHEAEVLRHPRAAARAPRDDGIGALVRRIEAFRRSREEAQRTSAAGGLLAGDPRLPLSDAAGEAPPVPLAILFACDSRGTITWAQSESAPMLAGAVLGAASTDAPVACDAASVRALRERRVVRAGRVTITGAAAITGAWRLDATPRFDAETGQFVGHAGILRRPSQRDLQPAVPSAHDRLRQLLHELRTPINAIQGFAELIQQQLFGAVAHQYRAMAASIAADAAQMLGGFDEIERLVKLETGRNEDMGGVCDLAAITQRLVGQLGPTLDQRGIHIAFSHPASLPASLDPDEAERLVWRLVATLAGAAQQGETLAVDGSRDRGIITIRFALPTALAALDDSDLFAVTPPAEGVSLSAGMLGRGFALRLAAAEARGANGSLDREGAQICLRLPVADPDTEADLTGRSDAHSRR